MPALRHIIPVIMMCVFASSALACEPCVARRSLERSVAQATVIVWVRNEDQNSKGNLRSGPDYVDLNVKKVIKGHPDSDYVRVRSWYGECAYGAQMQLNSEAVLLLEEANDIFSGRTDGTYKLVEDGCSESQLDVNGDDEVLVHNERTSISSFASEFGSR